MTDSGSMTNPSEAMRPCPFCGSTEVSMSYSATMDSPEPDHRFVECDDCAASGPTVKINDPNANPSAEESAIEVWNGAATPAAPRAICESCSRIFATPAAPACPAGFDPCICPDAVAAPVQDDAGRFYIDHGMIHDRITGKHVDTEPVEYEEGKFDTTPIEETCALLNSLARLTRDRVTPLVEALRKIAAPYDKDGPLSGVRYSDAAWIAKTALRDGGFDG